MKQTILACLLTTSTLPALAEWTKASETSEFISYIDFQSIRKDGNMRTAWQLQDLKQRGKKDGEMSTRMKVIFDCKGKRFDILSLTTHSMKMAGGVTLYEGKSSSRDWEDIPPHTPSETALKIICAK